MASDYPAAIYPGPPIARLPTSEPSLGFTSSSGIAIAGPVCFLVVSNRMASTKMAWKYSYFRNFGIYSALARHGKNEQINVTSGLVIRAADQSSRNSI